MMRRWSRRQFMHRALVCGVGLPSLFLAACGGGSSSTATSSTQATKTPAAGASPEGTHAHTGMPGMDMTGTPTSAPTSAATPVASASGSATASATPGSASGTATQAPMEVAIVEPSLDYQSWTYEPGEVKVPVGTTVIWTNKGGAAHTVTADDGKSFDSGSIAPDKTFSMVMKTAGAFPYHCTYHPVMKGTITVTE